LSIRENEGQSLVASRNTREVPLLNGESAPRMPWKSQQSKIIEKNFEKSVTEGLCQAVHFEGGMEDPNDNLTIKDVAKLLRCSPTQVQKALRGEVPGVPALTHLSVGRRKIVRRQWLNQWMERNKAS
jgi:hypothetical protein